MYFELYMYLGTYMIYKMIFFNYIGLLKDDILILVAFVNIK